MEMIICIDKKTQCNLGVHKTECCQKIEYYSTIRKIFAICQKMIILFTLIHIVAHIIHELFVFHFLNFFLNVYLFSDNFFIYFKGILYFYIVKKLSLPRIFEFIILCQKCLKKE